MSIFKKKEIQNGTLTDGQPNDALNFLPDDVWRFVFLLGDV